MSTFDYDLFVIGGGSGGVRAARVAAATGARVALAEESRMGGTCVIRGCVPKKLMVYASSFASLAAEAAPYGWTFDKGSFSWPAFRTNLHAELDRLEGIYQNLLKNSGVTAFASRARVTGTHEVTLADGQKITAAHILIATGGRPMRPTIENAHLGDVSDDVFEWTELPKSILVVGGGFIACEMAGILAGLGVKVTQFYRGAQILRGFDDEARGLIAESLKHHGVDLAVGTDIIAMAPAAEGIVVKATNGTEAVYDKVLFATGRRPNTANLGLEELGLTLGRHGEIPVDDYSQTAIPSIYAVGDVTNRINLTPVAIREGMAFVETVFKGNPTKPDHDLVPYAVFTQPELGAIGLTEEEAREAEPVEIYATSFRPMRTAFAKGTDRVMMKLIVSQATRKVLGCHIVAPDAGEMIQLAGIAVKMGATKEDFDRVCAVHPTMAEELVTMKTPVRVW